jgi:hypothetical protein
MCVSQILERREKIEIEKPCTKRATAFKNLRASWNESFGFCSDQKSYTYCNDVCKSWSFWTSIINI